MLREEIPQARRVMFVIEYLLLIPPKGAGRLDRLRGSIDSWALDTRMTAHLMDIEWRTDFVLELATMHGERTARTYEERLRRDYVPGEVMWGSESRIIEYTSTPIHVAVFHNYEDRTFGPKGERVEDPLLFDLDGLL